MRGQEGQTTFAPEAVRTIEDFLFDHRSSPEHAVNFLYPGETLTAGGDGENVVPFARFGE